MMDTQLKKDEVKPQVAKTAEEIKKTADAAKEAPAKVSAQGSR
jgi:hypothetical protein